MDWDCKYLRSQFQAHWSQADLVFRIIGKSHDSKRAPCDFLAAAWFMILIFSQVHLSAYQISLGGH